ncbi:hypothetical protein [Streptomyces sp. NPDC086023]|uniref:hypothetical protein n=1 Tax=Streptomyces sp. NPDC086023 TaxID=3365746 RepID=UPI0037D1EF84
MTTRTDHTARQLYTIHRHWTDLTDALDARTEQWPPSGKSDLLRALDARDADEVAYDRAHTAHRRIRERDPHQIGEVAAPINLSVLDTMRAVEAALVHCADTLAADIQRPASSPEDAANAARWRYVGLRDASYAALWLLARWDGHPGRRAGCPSPFLPLTHQQRARIQRVADEACARVERALDLVGRERILAEPCECGGPITLHGGGGASPVARCGGRCGQVWTMADAA